MKTFRFRAARIRVILSLSTKTKPERKRLSAKNLFTITVYHGKLSAY